MKKESNTIPKVRGQADTKETKVLRTVEKISSESFGCIVNDFICSVILPEMKDARSARLRGELAQTMETSRSSRLKVKAENL